MLVIHTLDQDEGYFTVSAEGEALEVVVGERNHVATSREE
jgi:hypothetical protein